VPALPPYLIELIFEQFCALLPERTSTMCSVATYPASQSGWSWRSWLAWAERRAGTPPGSASYQERLLRNRARSVMYR
jgi:hypothetical protein